MVKKILCLVLAVMVLLICVGCSSNIIETADDTQENTNTSMFIIVEGGVETCYQIAYHKDTKVMYAISRGSYNQGTFTVMVDADGKPLLWEG